MKLMSSSRGPQNIVSRLQEHTAWVRHCRPVLICRSRVTDAPLSHNRLQSREWINAYWIRSVTTAVVPQTQCTYMRCQLKWELPSGKQSSKINELIKLAACGLAKQKYTGRSQNTTRRKKDRKKLAIASLVTDYVDFTIYVHCTWSVI